MTRPEPWLNPDPLQLPEPVRPLSQRGCAWLAITAALVVFWTIVALIVVSCLATPSGASNGNVKGVVGATPAPRSALHGAPHVPGSAAGLQPRRGRPNDGASSLPAGRTVTTERLNPTPAPTPGDASFVTRSGTWAWADPSHGARYLATPEKRGTRMRVCGPLACLTLTTNDVGPVLSLQREGRIGDVSAATFQVICGELRFGLCPGTYTVLHRPLGLPETDAN